MTKQEAALFTDGRYFLQAGEQLDDNWTLMKQGLPGVPTWQEYIVNVNKRNMYLCQCENHIKKTIFFSVETSCRFSYWFRRNINNSSRRT